MGIGLEIKNFNINRFWEKTPTPLKYILTLSIIIVSFYLLFTDRVYKASNNEIKKIEDNIEVTYTLINNFEKYRLLQDQYNEKIVNYLEHLHKLVVDLSDITNKKFDIIIKSNSQNKSDIIDKLQILNESFDKLSKIYNIESDIKIDDLPGEKINKNSNYKIGVKKIDTEK